MLMTPPSLPAYSAGAPASQLHAYSAQAPSFSPTLSTCANSTPSTAHTQYPANSKRTLAPSPPTVRLHEPANQSIYSSADVCQRIVILRTHPSTQAAASSISHPMGPTSPGAITTASTAHAQFPANSKRTMTCPLPPTFRLHEPVLPANRSFYS